MKSGRRRARAGQALGSPAKLGRGAVRAGRGAGQDLHEGGQLAQLTELGAESGQALILNSQKLYFFSTKNYEMLMFLMLMILMVMF